MIVFKQVSQKTPAVVPLVDQTDCPAPNSHNLLILFCYAGMDGILKQTKKST